MALVPDDPAKAQVWLRNAGTPNMTIDFYIPRGNKGDPGGIVLGTDLGTADLNTIVTSGVYRQTDPLQVTQLNNYPIVGSGGILTVHQRDAGSAVVLQTYQMTSGAQDTRALWTRVRVSGTWSAWRTQASQRVDQTAGRAIYVWDDVNAREQLIYGDTGLRDVYADQTWLDALFLSGSVDKNASNVVRVRRTGSIVTLHVALDKAAAGSVSAPASIPLGFRPATPVHAIGANSGMALFRAYMGGGAAAVSYNSTAAAPAASFTVAYSTTDNWPATLPGTAIGAIPNL